MRPIRRGASPQPGDFADYRNAFTRLVGRLGSYCSYCERKIATQLAVEHIQPKKLPEYSPLVGRWENFLLGCVNCNSTKLDKNVRLDEVLLPDRDNTFASFEYDEAGEVRPATATDAKVRSLAKRTLALVGLDKKVSQVHDENGKLVAIDRVSQRMEARLTALDAKKAVDGHPMNDAVLTLTVKLARETGYFSIWMSVFEGNVKVRNLLIDEFAGTRASGCFDPETTLPVVPAPNPDGLASGGKT